MRKFIQAGRTWAVVAVMALLAACASAPRISSDWDPKADFSQYRTFSFYTPLAIESEGYTTLTSGRLKAAARAELEARGYVFDEKAPDLWLNINAYMQEKTDVVNMPNVDYNYYYSYRARRYVAVPYWYDNTQVYQYTEGTLNFDLVDAKRNMLVWEGIAVGRVGNDKPDARNAKLDQAVTDIFARFPYRAGSNTPTVPQK